MSLSGDKGAPAIDVEGLTKRFGRFVAVDEFCLRVQTGVVHGFLGPNGAGKSTTIRVLLGLYRRDGGMVHVLGGDPGNRGPEVTRRVSYVPGDVALWPALTGQQCLDALAGLRGRGRYDTARERDLVEAFSLDPSKRIRSYSKGNRQKVALVAAFAADTDLLILDEPTEHLDAATAAALMDDLWAAAGGRTVLALTHDPAVMERCDAVVEISGGRVGPRPR